MNSIEIVGKPLLKNNLYMMFSKNPAAKQIRNDFNRGLKKVEKGFAVDDSAAADKTYVVSYINFPPACFTNEKGEADGVLVNKARKIFSKLNLKYKLVEYPPRRLYLNWNDGEIDINLAPANVPEIKDRAFTTKEPLYNVAINSYRLKKTKKVRSLADFSDAIVGFYYQYSYVGLKNVILSKSKNLKILNINTINKVHGNGCSLIINDY